MALACGVAVALLGFAAEPFQEGAASSSGVAHEALFRLEVDLGCLPGGKALFLASAEAVHTSASLSRPTSPFLHRLVVKPRSPVSWWTVSSHSTALLRKVLGR